MYGNENAFTIPYSNRDLSSGKIAFAPLLLYRQSLSNLCNIAFFEFKGLKYLPYLKRTLVFCRNQVSIIANSFIENSHVKFRYVSTFLKI